MALINPSGINGSLRPYGTRLLLSALFQDRPAIPQMWVALLWGVLTDNHDGSTMPEVQARISDPTGSGQDLATNYQRAYYNSTDSAGGLRWNQSSSRSVYNTDPIVFPQAGQDWGQIRSWAIVNAISGGEIIAGGLASEFIEKGDQVVIDPNNLGFVVLSGT